MKLDVAYSKNEVETLGVKKSIDFKLDANSQQMIFAMFSKNIYSNPIGSVVREITSNCFDSHVEANVSDPVVVKLIKENSDYYINFIDVGVGLSPERMEKVYSQYFTSTKRGDNNQIGGFGLGSKSVLAYTDSIYVITNYDGVQYVYNVYKGTDKPMIDLLSEEPTSERNGTTIKVPVKSTDVPTFEREIKRQLYYFENIIFEGFGWSVSNDYKIIKSDLFLYRGNEYSNNVHICLGKVAYPIDYNALDISSSDWSMPIALKFDIGEINVTASREAIDYTQETKKYIIKKLNQLKDKFIKMLDAQTVDLNTIERLYEYQNNRHTLKLSDTLSINASCIDKARPEIKLDKYDAIKLPYSNTVIDTFFNIRIIGKKGRYGKRWNSDYLRLKNGGDVVYYDVTKTDRRKSAYLKTHFGGDFFEMLVPKQWDKIEMDDLIGKGFTPTKIQIEQIEQLRDEVTKQISDNVLNYSKVIVPDDFKVKNVKGYDANFEIPVTINSKYHVNDRTRIKLKDIENTKATVYYYTTDDESLGYKLFDEYINLFLPKENDKFKIDRQYSSYGAYPVRFIMVSKTNVKHLEKMKLKNLKPLSEVRTLFNRKRSYIHSMIVRSKVIAGHSEIRGLFTNYKLFKDVDADYAKVLRKIDITFNKFVDMYNSTISQTLMEYLGIDPSKFTNPLENEMAIVKNTIEKNKMLTYVSIHSSYTPSKKDEESEIIMQLIKKIYVK